MKMTMHIDEDVLDDVMRITSASTKTGAVEAALKELVRKHRFKTLAQAGLGLSRDELRRMWEDPLEAGSGGSTIVKEEPPDSPKSNARKRTRR